MPISNAAVYNALSGIKNECTRKTYEARLKALTLVLGEDVYGLCKRPGRHVPVLKRTYPSQCTRRNMASAVLAVFNLFPEMKSKKPRAWEEWAAFQRSSREGYRPAEGAHGAEIAAAYGRLRGDAGGAAKQSQRALLLSMAVHAPWAVRHGGTMAAVFPPETKSPSENYVYMCPNRPIMVAGRRKETVGRGLFADLSASLGAHPRGFLFVGSDGKPFRKQNSYGVFVKRAMEGATGEAIGVNEIARGSGPARAAA